MAETYHDKIRKDDAQGDNRSRKVENVKRVWYKIVMLSHLL